MLYGNKLEVWVRDLTVANCVSDVSSDKKLELPDENLEQKLNKEHEYIIIDSDIDLHELDNVFSINKWLLECDCSDLELKVMSKIWSWKDLTEKIDSENYQFHCFDDETETWNGGNGVLYDDWWIGYFLHEECGWRFDWENLDEKEKRLYGDWFREKIKDMEDYINYEHLYTQAQTEGLHEVNYEHKLYFIW